MKSGARPGGLSKMEYDDVGIGSKGFASRACGEDGGSTAELERRGRSQTAARVKPRPLEAEVPEASFLQDLYQKHLESQATLLNRRQNKLPSSTKNWKKRGGS